MQKLSMLVLGISLFAGAAHADDPQKTDITPCLDGARAWNAAYNKHDADAVAALYTTDAIMVSPTGVITGQAAIKDYIAKHIAATQGTQTANVSACKIDGNSQWRSGSWNETLAADKSFSGFWTVIATKSNGEWLITNHTYNVSPPQK